MEERLPNKPRVLDAFCCAGGCSYGFHLAGFEVVGVDNVPQPRYPFEFHLGDAIEFVGRYGRDFDLIAGSPPCQLWSPITPQPEKHHDLITPFRKAIERLDKPYVIENVPGAPLRSPVMLCGTMFGLMVIRHRIFEANPSILLPPGSCNHLRPVVKTGRRPDRQKHYHSIVGHFSDVEWAREIMGCPWMIQKDLAQAIPPAYTEWIGGKMREYLNI